MPYSLARRIEHTTVTGLTARVSIGNPLLAPWVRVQDDRLEAYPTVGILRTID